MSERGVVRLRPAIVADAEHFERWDRDPVVIAATSDDPDATKAFDDTDWYRELAGQSDVFAYYVAELDGRPIGAVAICDPHLEPTHYWGDVAPNQRAIDVWIGNPADRNRGHGSAMMRQAFEICFAHPAVTTILIDPLASNPRAHRFYQRLGFAAAERRHFGEDDCLVHRLTRAHWQARRS